jgi:membrane-bound lytic murein transglycosylase D
MSASNQLLAATQWAGHARAGLALAIALCAGCQGYAPIELPDARSPRLAMRGSSPADRFPVQLQETAYSDSNWAAASTGEGLWGRIGRDGSLWKHTVPNSRINQQISWLVGNPGYISSASGRASPYLHFIVQSLERRGLPRELALLPMIESSYNPTAVSVRQAVGLWQFMPATATDVGLRRTANYDGRRDVTASTVAAMDHLQRLHSVFQGDWLLALAAYNAGEGTVARAMNANRRQGLPTDYWHLSLPRETTDYVPRLLALSIIVNAPQAHGVRLRPVRDEPYFAQVALAHPVDLKQLSAASGVPEKTLRQLNPAYLKGTTQEGPGHLLVPVTMQQPLLAALNAPGDNAPGPGTTFPSTPAIAAANAP